MVTTHIDQHRVLGVSPAAEPGAVQAAYRALARKCHPDRNPAGDGYRVLGDKRERVKQYGQAVTPPVARWIWQRVVESLR